MKAKKKMLVFMIVAAVSIPSGTFAASDSTGTLVFNVYNYESEVKLKKKLRSQLDHGGVEWGLLEDELIVTLRASDG
jgi:hypothetical protein